MIVKVRIPRFASAGSTSGLAAPAPLSAGSTFHAALTDSAEDWVVRGAPRMTFVPRPEPSATKRPTKSVLVRAWGWLQSKYAQRPTKRLRVAETVSLGEKRFVSIVVVEGREFLIGGGTSGVSLLAHLSSTKESVSPVLKNSRGDVA